MSLKPGDIIDNKYRIVRLIGEGGMGSVHEGENTLIKRRVAIKVLHSQVARNEAVLRRFEREAQAAGRIGSDHILEVLDLGSLANGDRYMVLEFLDGEPLGERIERHGRLTAEQVQPLLRQALVGLQAAHAAGIIHRDLKPDNIFVMREKAGKPDFVKIIDFGISKFNVLGDDMAMTRTGAVMGTPYYMSPEQAKGSRVVDARSDLYSMGVIAYEALTGRVPFDGDTFNELMFKIALSDPPPLRELLPDLDASFAAIVEKMMNRDAEARYQSAAEVIATLDNWVMRSGQHAAMALLASNTGAAAAGHEPEVGAPAVGNAAASTGHGGTSSTWATSQVGELPKRRLMPLGAALLGGLVLIVGGAAAALNWLDSAADTAHTGNSATTAANSGLMPPAPSQAPPTPLVELAKPEPSAKTSMPPEPVDAGAEQAALAETATKPTVQASALRRVKAPAQPRPQKTLSTSKPRPTPKTTATAKPREFGY